MSKLKVLIQQPVLPLYRLPVFEALSLFTDLDITFTFGEPHPSSSLATINTHKTLKTHLLKNIYIKEGKFATYQKGLVPLVKSQKWDVIVIGLDPRSVTTLLAQSAARKRNIPVITWGKVKEPAGKFGNIYRRMIDNSSATLFYYEPTIDVYEKLGVPREKLFAAWNSIDTVTIEKLRDQEFSESRKTIIHLGRLIPAKKVDLLIKGFSLAIKQGLDSNLVIMGNGPLKPELLELIKSENIEDKAEIVSGVYDEEGTSKYFNKAWISVSPGELGLNIVHSFAYGVPILLAQGENHSSEVSIAKEGENSLWFPGQNPQALADCLIQTRNNFNLLKKMSVAGHDYVHANFSAEGMASRIRNAILYVTQRSG